MRLPFRALLAVAVAALLVFAAPAQAIIPQGNTLLNGDAETGTAVSDETSHLCPQGWACEPLYPNATLARYGAAASFPSSAESARIGGGGNLFAGGPSNTLSVVQQTVVLGDQPEFEAGTVKATFGGCLGGFADQNDRARIIIAFLTKENPDTGVESSRFGPSAAERGNQTALVPVSQTVAVPPQTHAFRFSVAFEGSGGYDNGYADNLSVTFGPAAGPDPPAASCAAPGGGAGPGGGPGPGGGDPGAGPGGGDPGTTGRRDPAKLLSFGAAVIGRDGKARVRVTCTSTQVARCRGTVTAALANAPQSLKRKPAAASFSIASGRTSTVRITLSSADVRRIRGFTKRSLATRRLKLSATTRVDTLRFRQTALVKLSRPG